MVKFVLKSGSVLILSWLGYKTVNALILKNWKLSDFRGQWFYLSADLLRKLDRFAGELKALGYTVMISPADRALMRFGPVEEGEVNNSQHYLGNAADVMLPGGPTLKEAYGIAEKIGFGGIGVYPDWLPYPGLHLDVRARRKANGSAFTWSGLKRNGKQFTRHLMRVFMPKAVKAVVQVATSKPVLAVLPYVIVAGIVYIGFRYFFKGVIPNAADFVTDPKNPVNQSFEKITAALTGSKEPLGARIYDLLHPNAGKPSPEVIEREQAAAAKFNRETGLNATGYNDIIKWRDAGLVRLYYPNQASSAPGNYWIRLNVVDPKDQTQVNQDVEQPKPKSWSWYGNVWDNVRAWYGDGGI